MRVLVSDYKEQMFEDYTLTKQAILELCPEADIMIEPFGTETFYEELKKAEGLISAFLPIDAEFLEKAPKLRCISQNSVGFSNIDLEEADKRKVAVCHIVEYCTREVAEHTLALLLALCHNLETYAYDIREKGIWSYQAVEPCQTINHKSAAIFGLGRIGRETARLLNALGMKVYGVDPYVEEAEMKSIQAIKLSAEDALKNADVVINHMSLTKENYHFFDAVAFDKMKRDALFINVGRGGCVNETDLLDAIRKEKLAGVALDVLENENPDMTKSPFVNQRNVILTPHCAFHSVQSIEKLHQISGRNVAYCLLGQYQKVEGLENKYIEKLNMVNS